MTEPDAQKSYYGPFFWIAAVSFIVPFFVAVYAFDAARPPAAPQPAPDASGVDHALWDYLLKTYVAQGLVDYDGIARDYTFHLYLRQLGGARPADLPSDAARLALLCNAYNAFVIQGVIAHHIRDSVNSYKDPRTGKGFFDMQEHILANETVSLNTLEHQRIRGNFDEPRIHVALVCAALSCPKLRSEAYVGDRLDAQLEDQARLFANNPEHVRYDAAGSTLYLSRILEWYGSDWEGHGGYLQWLHGLVEDPDLKAALLGAASGTVTVAFLEYDWTLNSQGEIGRGTAARPGAGAFGSGSIPNE